MFLWNIAVTSLAEVWIEIASCAAILYSASYTDSSGDQRKERSFAR